MKRRAVGKLEKGMSSLYKRIQLTIKSVDFLYDVASEPYTYVTRFLLRSLVKDNDYKMVAGGQSIFSHKWRIDADGDISEVQ